MPIKPIKSNVYAYYKVVLEGFKMTVFFYYLATMHTYRYTQ